MHFFVKEMGFNSNQTTFEVDRLDGLYSDIGKDLKVLS
jgi:hypothetical protein